MAEKLRTKGSPILAKPEQLQCETMALKLYAGQELQEELAKAKALFAKSPIAENQSARATIDRCTESLAFSAALYAANFDTARPFILWGTNAADEWGGVQRLTSGYGLDAPDNVYRSCTFDGAGKHVIRGKLHGKAPSQQTFVIYRTIPGVTQTMNNEGHMDEIAGIKSEVIVRDGEGNFTISVDSQPANGRKNHLQVPAEFSSLHLLVRDSLADWTTELPVDLTIERLDAPKDAPRLDEGEMARHAAEIMRAYAPYWLRWFETYLGGKPLNEIVQPWKRVQGWGMTQQGRFGFAHDECWLMTFDPLGAKFFDMQVCDPWAKACEYVTRTGSFNANQAVANPDGTITMVAAHCDVGVHNWLDTAGLTVGTFQCRWQSVPDHVTGEGSVRDVRVVKLADLPKLLPKGTRFVNADERVAQLRARAASYANRLQ